MNARLHSAGHLIDIAVKRVGLVVFYIIIFKLKNWQPNKGYHFPDSPYVEYIGNYDSNVQSNLLHDLN